MDDWYENRWKQGNKNGNECRNFDRIIRYKSIEAKENFLDAKFMENEQFEQNRDSFNIHKKIKETMKLYKKVWI